jgi:hypothetical protein
MRDNHEGMPEILDAFEKDGHYFSIVRLEHNGQERRFRFGVSHHGYLALKRVFELRPFSTMPGLVCRYFFVPSYCRLDESHMMMTVRVEQGRDGKQMEIEAPRDLVANLKWFIELDDWQKAEHLHVA